jgi:drug/metabolite transporter (DMT)-like permease
LANKISTDAVETNQTDTEYTVCFHLTSLLFETESKRMNSSTHKKGASPLMIIIAFAIIYIVWGSTYFFIMKAMEGFPPFMLGGFRFITAGFVMLGWCLWRKEKLFEADLRIACVTGLLLLFVGNGAVIWAERTVPSSLAAILVSSAPLWFVLLDKPKWKTNLTNTKIILGLLIGLVGVSLLFSKQLGELINGGASAELTGLGILLIGCASWAGGSLFSKYKSKGSAVVNTTWQMLAGGMAFTIISVSRGELNNFQWSSISSDAWLSMLYLIFFGSIAAFSAYIWLLEVRPATQVSTYAYVNPVVAVILGVLFANEVLHTLQLVGLAVILCSVVLINKAKE